jgi:hypothetical protein
VDVARGLPPVVQDELARVLLELAGEDRPIVEMTPEEEASFQESLAQDDRREFATDVEVRTCLGEARALKLRYTSRAIADLRKDEIVIHGARHSVRKLSLTPN